MSQVELFDKMLFYFKLWIFQRQFIFPWKHTSDFLLTGILNPTTNIQSRVQSVIYYYLHACCSVGSGISGSSFFIKLMAVLSFVFIQINKELWILTSLRLQVCFQKLL